MAKAIMIQGTMSNAGKSLIAAALCRIFKQDGYKVAPFKSQNMALNSYITLDGLEMGRAQVMQAEAAGTEPDVRMNPILLKPTTDVGAQVIVNGKVKGNMSARDYFKSKSEMIPDIMAAYESLSSEYDIIVIEGAGSPVELNLKTDDIVNMGMAKLVNAPVLIVGDIDRGGVFAQLLGTYYLLEDDEKELVKGFVVNKFRGDISLFDDGINILKDKSGVDVLGVVPYMNVDIEDEDSLSVKLENTQKKAVDIVVIRLPKLSNFTDFDVFNQYENVSVRYVQTAEQLDSPDMIIIPGTKSTIDDMLWMRQNGLEAAVKKKVAEGIPIFGVCGGYQILGMSISDPDMAENGGTIRGMELLPVDTVFGSEKKRTRVDGVFKSVPGVFAGLTGKKFGGYEIHMGSSVICENNPVDHLAVLNREGEKSGCESYPDGVAVGNVYGSYVHGIFDEGEVSDIIVEALCKIKGIENNEKKIGRHEYKEMQYDKMADIVRENIDVKRLYEIMGLHSEGE